MPTAPVHATLTRHDDSQGSAVRGVDVRIARTAGGTLAATYVFEGDIDRMRLPQAQPRCVTDRLWEHTCCEMFIARKGTAGYHEFDFAPSGDWTGYAFQTYRERAVPDTNGDVRHADPQIALRRTPKTLELDILMRLGRVSSGYADGPLSLALAAVVEDQNGRFSYWALAHPPGEPDFHHPDAFALTLDEVRD